MRKQSKLRYPQYLWSSYAFGEGKCLFYLSFSNRGTTETVLSDMIKTM